MRNKFVVLVGSERVEHMVVGEVAVRNKLERVQHCIRCCSKAMVPECKQGQEHNKPVAVRVGKRGVVRVHSKRVPVDKRGVVHKLVGKRGVVHKPGDMGEAVDGSKGVVPVLHIRNRKPVLELNNHSCYRLLKPLELLKRSRRRKGPQLDFS